MPPADVRAPWLRQRRRARRSRHAIRPAVLSATALPAWFAASPTGVSPRFVVLPALAELAYGPYRQLTAARNVSARLAGASDQSSISGYV